jgi:hypothetical protein
MRSTAHLSTIIGLLVALAACGDSTSSTPDLRRDQSVAADLARDRTVDQAPPDTRAPDACIPKTWYADQDGDTYGDAKTSKQACAQPAGYVADSTDCDDTNKDIHPGAPELCNGVDDDCNTKIDDVATGTLTFCKDVDGDGYGDPAVTVKGCAPPAGYVTSCTDCNDADLTINPKAADAPDAAGLDSNCDSVDGDVTQAIFVAPSGDDTTNDGKGTFIAGVLNVSPVKTVAQGVKLAALCTPGPCRVLIAEGTYDQGATPLAISGGVSLHGGYTDVVWTRTLTRDKVVITSTASPAVKADTLTVATMLDRLTIVGPDLSALTTSGEESVAMIVTKTSGAGVLTLRDVQIEAGKGSPGIDGTAGTSGPLVTCSCDGGNGSTENACWTASPVSGSPGACGTIAGGGGAGSYSCQDICGYGPTVPYNAGAGAAGKAGANGAAGAAGAAAAAAAGSFTGSDWMPSSSGGAGGNGVNGGGGGGGGGGGHQRWWCDGWLNANSVELAGGAGGKGGKGGCAGTGGTGGGPGGAALGVLLVESTVTFDTVAIKLGRGGDGGKGGGGGYGQGFTAGAGGAGSASGGSFYGLCPPYGGLLCPYYAMTSGAGGAGGDGGFGGGGAGGAGGHGGPSYGLVVIGSPLPSVLPTYDSTASSGGTKGIGGAGGKMGDNTAYAPKGADGAQGVLTTCLVDGAACP